MKFWHPVDPPIVGNFDSEDHEKEYSTHDGLEIGNGETLNIEVTKCFDIGQQRSIDNCQKNYIETPFKNNRSEKDVAFTRLLATTYDREQEKKKYLHRETSTKVDELDASMNQAEAAKQLGLVRDWLNNNLLDEDMNLHRYHHIVISKMNKKDMIKKLAELRIEYFTRDVKARERHEVIAAKAFDEKYPNQAAGGRLTDLSSHKIYCLDDNVLSLDRYSQVPDNQP